ncbi:MAG: SH3 domain-containing protein [Chitinispirillales bacterium]|jgi:uncharacterized protein YraI|nr:SH3 domain-containing protein [Chitinispirillales bacterium]
MSKRVWVLVCTTLLFLCAWGAGAEQLEITGDVRMRAEPDKSAEGISIVPKGSMVPFIDRQDNWYKIEYNGEQGWIFSKYARQRANAGDIFTKQDVSMLPPVPVGGDGEPDQLARIIADGTPILEYIGEDAPVLYTARSGEAFPLIGEGEAWCKIVYKDTTGWVKKSGVEISDSKPSKKYAQVKQDNTLIRYYLDPQAPYLYKARKGDWFVLVDVGKSGTWCKVIYKDTTGWILVSDVDILTTEPTKANIVVEEAKTLVFGLLALGIVVLIVSVIVTLRHIKTERMRNIYVQKNALILAKESKHVQYMLTNATATMEHCFAEIGFNVSVAKDSVTARNHIENNMPDLILVDWDFETAIFAKIDNLFVRLMPQNMPHFLFYNVPDPTSVPPGKALRNVNFLGLSIVDRDIFKVVTPLLIHKGDAGSANDMQKGLQRCALEGEIAGGNLLEVLQFIEIGSKTGCLMVETRGPFGLVYFSDGRIIYAAAKGPDGGPIYGVEGVYEILNQPMGKFRFITNKQPKVANLNLPTLSVLMEWTKEKDEAHKSR